MPEYTPELRAKVDAAMAKATEGEWYLDAGFEIIGSDGAQIATTFADAEVFRTPDECEANGRTIVTIHNAYPILTAHIDAQAERIAELERDNARLRKGLQSVKIQDTRNEYQTYLNYAEDREYSTKVEVEGPCAKIARAALAKARA